MTLTPNQDPWETSKNVDTLREFVIYCKNHPEERFWQALRNWARVANWLVFSKTGPEAGQIDPFYWEGKNK